MMNKIYDLFLALSSIVVQVRTQEDYVDSIQYVSADYLRIFMYLLVNVLMID